MASPDRSFKSLLSELISEVNHLVRQELRLAQAEATEKIDQAQNGALSVLAGILIGFVALIVLVEALVIALSNVVAPWIAAIIVGGALAVIGFALVKIGQNSLKPSNLTPERTIRTVRGDEDRMTEETP